MTSATNLIHPFTLNKNSLINGSNYHQKTWKLMNHVSGSGRRGKSRNQRRKIMMEILEAPLKNLVQSMENKQPTILNLTAIVTVKFKKTGLTEKIRRSFGQQHDQAGVFLQFVSRELDPETMKPKMSKKGVVHWSKGSKIEEENHIYKVEVEIDSNFGVPGAVLVSNQYEEEFFLMSISVEGSFHFACKSWIHPTKTNSETRVFFYEKACLPSDTPKALKDLRDRELKILRGDGKGLRLSSDRIYDYDVYNDLGNPDKGPHYVRPTLGGEKSPYPRRCRTGRPPTVSDVNAEAPAGPSDQIYIPRDEEYEQIKQDFMTSEKLKAVLSAIIPIVIAKIFDEKKIYHKIDDDHLHQGKTNMQIVSLDKQQNKNPILLILTKIQELMLRIANFDPPKYISKGLMWGLTDDEFGRRVLAGLNPANIEKLKTFPPVSKLDPSIYGPQESALKEKHITSHLERMSVQQAIDEGKLFVLDYHDVYLPYVEQINELEMRKGYATRTIFFLTPLGTLKPIAIELSLPSEKRVLTPSTDGTTYWLWQLAKEHVCSNDAAVQTLINHWLRIHACMEPFIISAHRNLSMMHPIFKLLHPHMRYLMKTNAFSRKDLINAGAIIETYNAPEKYCMEFSGSVYGDWWRFDQEGLPQDLIRRGMAIHDSTKPHGIKLIIEDYPYAQDGLLIWDAIEKLVKKYVNYYYPEPRLVLNDTELQAWYNEFVNVGHAGIRNASWWPKLSTPNDLIKILTTIIWTVTGQHAILNFGQYNYGGYAPARPSFMRKLLPSQNDSDNEHFLKNPQEYFLSSLPSFTDALKFARVLHTGSGHSPDEEYIGERNDLSSWSGDPKILEAFYEFSMDVKTIEKEIERRNIDPKLRNRCGGEAFPFEQLMPSSGAGTTGRGVPNSVTA